jgi:tRNA(fMet)-specific endonuclease VapC
MYLLDTNTCIYIINKKPERVRVKFEAVSLAEIGISSITLFELDAGARKGSKAKENLKVLERFASVLQILPFDAVAAREAGKLRQHLRERGTPIGDMDMLIAAHALSVSGIVVTNNIKEFARVPNLKTENWLE